MRFESPPDPLDDILGAECGEPAYFAGRLEPSDPPTPRPPTNEQVEALARALMARADACPATTLPDREAALAYFRSQARGRLSALNNPAARGLLLGFERHRKGDTVETASAAET